MHANAGYAPEKLEAFRPDPAARASVRRELGLPADTQLLGLVARFHPQKDHRTFLRAAGEVRRWRGDAHFVLCGRGVTRENTALREWTEEFGVQDCCHFLGERQDVAHLQAALDVACLSSAGGEAFPLVLGEAMACGVPCVTTDVADSALLVGETGRVVPPRDAAAFAGACRQLLDLPTRERERLGAAARRRIATNFALPRIAQQYEAFHEQLARGEWIPQVWEPRRADGRPQRYSP